MRNRLHLKVGLFINIGIILFIGAVLALGRAKNVFSRSSSYYISTRDAQGLIRGATVMLSGVSVGTVSNFEIKPGPRPVKISISIDSGYSDLIRVGTIASLSTVGVVGERIVAITPGDASNPLIAEKQEIPFHELPNLGRVATEVDRLIGRLNRIAEKLDRGIDPVKIDSLVEALDRVVTKVDRGSGTISALLNDPELYDDAKALLGEANENRVVRNLVRRAVQNAQKQPEQAAGSRPNEGGSS